MMTNLLARAQAPVEHEFKGGAGDCAAVSGVPQVFRIGELFSGAGGLALGASMVRSKAGRFKHVWANDIDRHACRTFERNLPKCSVICRDVAELDFDSLEPIDGLAFGFPCNDFSTVGERKGISGQYGGLYIWGARALRHFQPLFFVAENVSGLRSTNGRRDMQRIISALEDTGYNIYEKTYRFESYGVPQRRHRCIIVGFRKDLDVTHKHPPPKPHLVSCKDAISKPPIAHNAPNNERTAQSAIVVERLKLIKPGENVFTANLPPRLQLNMQSGASISQIYKRLDPNKPSYTVTGSGGGGTHVYHWEEPRALTNRERARLQSFPDSYVFLGQKESVRKQIGMSVPPKGAKVVFQAILRTLDQGGIKPQT